MAILKYDIPYTFADKEFLADGSVSPGAISEAFQAAADAQATACGLGFSDLLRDGLMWVIVKLRFELSGEIKPGVTYTVTTVPHPRKALTYPRDFFISAPDGTEVCKGSSLWCILSFESRGLTRERREFQGEYVDIFAFPDGFPHLGIKPDGSPVYSHTVIGDDIDGNGHMNNCKYTAMIGNVPGISSVRALSISFNHEAYLGDEITVLEKEDAEQRLLYGILPDGTLIFSASVS